MQTILLATDGSPSAVRATETAIELASQLHARLHVVTVWSVPASAFGYAPVSIVPELAQAERAAAENVADRTAAQAEAAGIPVTVDVREGLAVDEICAAACTRDASFVVVGAHGWGALKRLVFGSVSTGVLQHAPCPVLVVRGAAVDEAVEAADARHGVPAAPL
ncbi:MAG TPA: universal stress protein [Gaiellaceae bacterium]|nr:universal stress protein [Gaiellaceae bacterium]